ncbi:MAG TPA: NHL repeat-containing protein, partial [Candidatus Krumholzibacterium sp.]|nr:NHL repeat-containing protein [Candidatus Krumholzibacterium sp.]
MRLRELMILFFVSLIVLSVLASARDGGTTLTSPPWNHSPGLRHVDGLRLSLMTAFKSSFDDPQGVFCVVSAGGPEGEQGSGYDGLTIFSVNGGSGAVLYNTNGWMFEETGSRDDGDVSLEGPRDVTGDTSGNVFVADTGNDRVVRLFFDGERLAFVSSIDSAGGMPLSGPSGVSVSNERLYIADTGNDRIVVTDYDGVFERALISTGSGSGFQSPTSVNAVSGEDGWYYYSKDYITVIDSLGKRLVKIFGDGKGTLVMRYSDLPDGAGRFDRCAIDYYSNIYITDPVENAIHKIDRHMNHIVTLGGRGRGKLALDQPRGISIFRRFGQVVVAERDGLKYFWVGTDLLDFKASGLEYDRENGRCSVEVDFLLTEHSMLDIYLDRPEDEGPLYFARDFLLPGGHFNRRIEVPCTDIPTDDRVGHRLVA